LEQRHNYQLERKSLLWLLGAVLMSVAPHAQHIPSWLFVVLLFIILLRFLIYRGRVNNPPAVVKWSLILLGVIVIVVHYRTLFGPQAGVAIFLYAYTVKLLEMHRERDAYLIVILSYFAVATQWLFDTSLFTSLYLLLVIVVITTALISLNQRGAGRGAKAILLLAARMLMLSMPLLVLLFLFFPRLPPFWGFDTSSQEHISGLSESMSPSDVVRLGRSNKLAFRAEFDGDIPAAEKLYWRSLVFEDFDGQTWSIRHYTDNGVQESIYWKGRAAPWWMASSQYLGAPTQYEIILEPTGKQYVPALDLPKAESFGVGITKNFTLVSREPIKERRRFKLESHTRYELEGQMTRHSINENSVITDMKTRELARWRRH